MFDNQIDLKLFSHRCLKEHVRLSFLLHNYLMHPEKQQEPSQVSISAKLSSKANLTISADSGDRASHRVQTRGHRALLALYLCSDTSHLCWVTAVHALTLSFDS